MARTSKPAFSVPPDFTDNPTEATLPRQLIVYDEETNTWDPTTDKDTIVRTKYLCVSYRQSDFPDRQQLERDIQTTCHQYNLPAYWLDYACTGETQEEKNRDLYRIADVFRGAAKTLIILKGDSIKIHSPGWLSWGGRLWTLPEALLSGHRGDNLIYKAGSRPPRSTTLREIANFAYENGEEEMELMNAYGGEPVIASDKMFESLCRAIWRRSSGPGKGKDKGGAFTAYEAERVYALMGFMAPNRRIWPDPNESEEEAFSRLMKINKLKMSLSAVLNLAASLETNDMMSTSEAESILRSQDYIRLLDEIPYTGDMSFRTEKRCLEDTRRDIIDKITDSINNIDGTHSDKRVFLLAGVAGSGKSSIAHSIASKYNDLGQLGSSFFFSVTYKQNSLPVNLFRNIARDLAGKNAQYKSKLLGIVKDDPSLRTTASIERQFEYFMKKSMDGVNLVSPTVVVIDALDECNGSFGDRDEMLMIIAEEMSALPLNFRIFLTVRSGDAEALEIFSSSEYARLFRMDEIDSETERLDIRAYFRHKLLRYTKELAKADAEWLDKLVKMASGLFIYASAACSYILKSDGRPKSEKLLNVLSFKQEVDLNSPSGYLYELYTEVLVKAFDIQNLSRSSRTSFYDRFRRVLGVVLVASKPLSCNDIIELLGTDMGVKPIISQMGSLLDGASDSNAPVRLLHASFGDFLKDETLSGEFYIDVQKQHGLMAKCCLELMNKSLKFNFFEVNDVSVPDFRPKSDFDMGPDEEKIKTWKQRIRQTLQYSCLFLSTHIVGTRKDDYLELIQAPLSEFLEEHLMHWIEVISVLMHMRQARGAIFSLYGWLKENANIDKNFSLILELCQIWQHFAEPIMSGPLQVYISALPYTSPDSLLHILYSKHLVLTPQVLFGQIKDWRLLSFSIFTSWAYPSKVAFSSDGNRIAFVPDDGEVTFMDFRTLEQEHRISKQKAVEEDEYGPNEVHCLLVFSPNGNKVAAVSSGGLEVWKLKQGGWILVRERSIRVMIRLSSIAFPTDDHVLICCLKLGYIELQDISILNNGVSTSRFSSGGQLSCMALSASGDHLGAISGTSRLSIWDVADQKAITQEVELGYPEDTFQAISLSYNGQYVACGSKNGVIMLWELQTASFIWTKKLDSEIEKILMPLTLKNAPMVIASKSKCIHVWNMASESFYKHEKEASVAAISPDGRYLISTSGHILMVGPNREASKTSKSALFPGEEAKEVIILPGGSLMACGTGLENGDIIVWEKIGEENASRQILKSVVSFKWKLRLSPEGRRLISWDGDGSGQDQTILFWCRDDDDANFVLREKLKLADPREKLKDILFLHNGSILACGTIEEGTIVVWKNFGTADSTKQILEGYKTTWRKWRLKFSSDGKRLVGRDDQSFRKVISWSLDIGSDDIIFELQKEHDFRNSDDSIILFNKLLVWDSEREGLRSTVLGTQTEGDGSELTHGRNPIFGYKRQWLCSYYGRKLWYIPDAFSEVVGVAQNGHKIVLYGGNFALLFDHKDVRAVLSSINNSL